jgi:hypothetical protein
MSSQKHHLINLDLASTHIVTQPLLTPRTASPLQATSLSLLEAQYAISPASRTSSRLRLLKLSTLLSPTLLRRQPGFIAYVLSLDTPERIPSLLSCTATTSLLLTSCTLRVTMSVLNMSIYTTTTSKTALRLGISLYSMSVEKSGWSTDTSHLIARS